MTTTQPMRSVSERRAKQRQAHTRNMPNRWRRRLRNSLRTIVSRGDITSLLITWSLLVITAQALNTAEWTHGLGSLALIGFFAVSFGFLLARSHYSEWLALVLSTIYSLLIILTTNAYTFVENGSFRERAYVLVNQLTDWLGEALVGGQPAHDNVAFVVFLSILFWFLGHNAAWHVFRVDRVWRVIIPTGLVLITNQFYYQGDNTLDGYLIAFVILSLLLLIRSHIDAREFDWYVHRVSFPNYVRRTFFQAGGMLALMVMLVAWAAPAGNDDKSLERLNRLISGDLLGDMADLWNRLFSSLEGEGIATADYYGGDELQLTGAIQLGDQPVMSVKATPGPRYYWRSTAYDTYAFGAGTWKHIRSVRAYTDEDGLRLNVGTTVSGARREVEQTFTMLIRASRLVYAAPQPVLLGLPVEAELDCVDDLGRNCVNDDRQSDVSIIRARKTLRNGDMYTVTSSISTATAHMLRAAGQSYPDWVLRLYLQGAMDIPSSIRELTVQIIEQAGGQNPYDKAKAIERWLRTNIQYNESIPAPPTGRDPVEWFLFDRREGYCNYYATAMILMLRSQGIPARMAAGFAQGAWDPSEDAFLVRERDAHTWVEVYFPGYGWVEFEPTADEAPLDREGDEIPQTVLPTVTPIPSPTPTATPPPTVPPPTEPGGGAATPTSQANMPVVPATPTPPPSTPTATPPPPPDLTKVDADRGNNTLRIILWTLAIFVLVLLLLALTIVFLIWYIEYRGLGGLNMVQRAYARMGIYAGWLGFKFEQSATPDERRRYLVGEVPEGEEPINTITHTYIRDRYAPEQPDSATQDRMAQEAWQEARGAFIRRKLARFIGQKRHGER